MKNKEEHTTILGEDIQFQGKIKFQNTLEINGRIEGEVLTHAGDIIIHPQGKVKASIQANNLTHYGYFTGTIRTKNCLTVYKGAEIHGEVSTKDLSFERGAHFQGTCRTDAGEQHKQIGNT